jgi:DNA-binding NarL/FixJ family response regulator
VVYCCGSPRRGEDVAEELAPPGPGAPIRVLIVDDHLAFSEALQMVMNLQEDVECVGSCASVAETLPTVRRYRPDVVLMDVALPDGDGIKAAAEIKASYPDIQVIFLTGYADLDVMTRAAATGASGFMPKEVSFAEVLRAVRYASSGGMLVQAETLAALLDRVRGKREADGSGRPRLTQRESEVLILMGAGLDPMSIARRLGIGLSTVRTHVKNVLAKLDVHSQLEAVVRAARMGLLPG